MSAGPDLSTCKLCKEDNPVPGGGFVQYHNYGTDEQVVCCNSQLYPTGEKVSERA